MLYQLKRNSAYRTDIAYNYVIMQQRLFSRSLVLLPRILLTTVTFSLMLVVAR